MILMSISRALVANGFDGGFWSQQNLVEGSGLKRCCVGQTTIRQITASLQEPYRDATLYANESFIWVQQFFRWEV